MYLLPAMNLWPPLAIILEKLTAMTHFLTNTFCLNDVLIYATLFNSVALVR